MNFSGNTVGCTLLRHYMILLHFEIRFIDKVMMSRWRYLWMEREYVQAISSI